MIFTLDSYNVYDIPAPYGKDINDYLCYSIGLKNRQEIDKYKKKKEQNRVPIWVLFKCQNWISRPSKH